MNRLILDYLRRWRWILALAGALQLKLGWTIAKSPQEPFEFWAFMIAMWMGAVLLSFDLQRGVARAVASLPLTARQIGRGWWLATIPIPAVALSALLFSGAGAFHYFHPDQIFPAGRLAMASLFVLPWLGSTFTGIYGMNNDFVIGKGRERSSTAFFSLLSTIMVFGGMLTLQNATEQPFKFAIYLGVGAVLIVAGWIRAERFVLGRASFRLPTVKCKSPSGQYRAPGGYGGIAFLVKTTFVRTFLTLVALVALMALIRHWQRQMMPQGLDVVLFAQMGSFMSCFLISFLQPMAVLRQVRFLRTLPISATNLAGVMIAIGTLPIFALGVVVTGVAVLCLGTPVALTFLQSYTFILAPVSLCVFVAVWQGVGKLASACLLLIIFGFQLVPLWLHRFLLYPNVPFVHTGTFVAFCILLAFLLTRRAFLRSSHAYRVQASTSGILPCATGR